MELYEGRPADAEARLPREKRVYDFLDELGIAYYRTDHEAAGTMEQCVEKVLREMEEKVTEE